MKNKLIRKPKKPKKPIYNEQGNPIIEHLTDFVTSINNTYTSRPLYTGGRIMATANNLYSTCNHKITIYSLAKQQVIDIISHNEEEIVNFCVCPQEKFIVTFTQNSLIRTLSLQTKKVINTQKINTAFAQDIVFSADGRFVAFAFGTKVEIFTFDSMKRTHAYYPSGSHSQFVITRLKWHPGQDSLQLVSTDLQRNICVFDYILNKVVAISEVNEGGSDFCIDGEGSLLASINNMELKVYDIRGLKLKFKVALETYMESIYIVGKTLFFGGEDTELLSLDCSDNGESPIITHSGCTDHGVSKIMGFPTTTGHTLFVISTEQNISVLKLQLPLRSSLQPPLQSSGMIVGFNDEIIDIKCSQTCQKPEESSDQEEHERYFILVSNSNNVKVMNRRTHQLEFLITGHTDTVLCAEYWHPYVVTAGKDREIKLWLIDPQTPRVHLVANYHGHSANVLGLAIMPNSKTIASVSDDKTLKMWPLCQHSLPQKIEIRSSLHTTSAHAKTINTVRVSANEDRLATCSHDRTIKIWSNTLMHMMTLSGHKRGVWDAVFHPIEELLVSAGGEGMLKGWNLQTGENLWSMGEGPSLIRCSWVYFNQIVTGSLDGIIKIWDIRKMTSLSYDKHEGKIWALETTRHHGKARIYSGGTDSVYHVWDDNTADLRSDLMHQKQLKEQERMSFDQFMETGDFIQAALVAFKGGYTKLFIEVIETIGCSFDPENRPELTEEGIINQDQPSEQPKLTDSQFASLVHQLAKADCTRLLLTLSKMNSTVRHYKMANRILNQLFTVMSFNQLLQLNKSFVDPTEREGKMFEQFNERKSGLQKWLQLMVSQQGRHGSRVEKYIRGTYWIEELGRIANPYVG